MRAMQRQLFWCVAIGIFGGMGPSAAEAVEWRSRINLSQAENQTLVDDWGPQGWVPIYSKVSVVDGRRQYDLVYMKMAARWEYRSSLDAAAYERMNRDMAAQGLSQVSHHTYVLDGTTYHNMIWHK
jgi:hypothetical protein